ncbi:PREDICTED: transcription initiation factor TFIID subunit 3-like [Nicrophorus vespilloides]|uniref:Transcription initiation factor TFIID subunit 3-like n=1 Tax=Nicrophorus vespilloides TaxID=110193 RepID=A0ABM1NEQ5_NICVS|nr:PREDICTED: transcription initiation factor TFIID subunit 3-like [Nicrophorus vespilloides]
MTAQYSRDMLKVAVAKLLQTVGWDTSKSDALEYLTDILEVNLNALAERTKNYANHFGCVDPNLDHLGLAFKDFKIHLNELQDYVSNTSPIFEDSLEENNQNMSNMSDRNDSELDSPIVVVKNNNQASKDASKNINTSDSRNKRKTVDIEKKTSKRTK